MNTYLYLLLITCSSIYAMQDSKHLIIPSIIDHDTPDYLQEPYFNSPYAQGETHQVIGTPSGPFTRRTGRYYSITIQHDDSVNFCCTFQPSSASSLEAKKVIPLKDISALVNGHVVDHHTHTPAHGLEFQWFAAQGTLIKKYSLFPFKKTDSHEVHCSSLATLPFSPTYLGYNHTEQILLAAREDAELCAAVLIQCATHKQYELAQWQPHYHQLIKKLEYDHVQVKPDFFTTVEWNLTQNDQ